MHAQNLQSELSSHRAFLWACRADHVFSPPPPALPTYVSLHSCQAQVTIQSASHRIHIRETGPGRNGGISRCGVLVGAWGSKGLDVSTPMQSDGL